MHVLYTACAHDAKKTFFAQFIELDRSFSKQFEFCKSDENWAQLLALKLYANVEAIRYASYFDVLDVLISLLIFFSLQASENIKNMLRIASTFTYNFKASNWAQFSSDLQNSNCFEELRSSSINFANKIFFCSCAHAAYKTCIYIYIY
jgi:hypothetical protein